MIKISAASPSPSPSRSGGGVGLLDMDALEEREGALKPPQSKVPFALVPAPGAPPLGPVLRGSWPGTPIACGASTGGFEGFALIYWEYPKAGRSQTALEAFS